MTAPADHAATVRTPQEILATGAAWLTEAELARIVALADRASELEDRIEELEARWRQHMNFCTRPPA